MPERLASLGKPYPRAQPPAGRLQPLLDPSAKYPQRPALGQLNVCHPVQQIRHCNPVTVERRVKVDEIDTLIFDMLPQHVEVVAKEELVHDGLTLTAKPREAHY
jgi:hypothetical protein